MKKLTTVVLRHRALVTLAWIVLTVVGALLVGKANSGLSHTQATPGLAGYEANQAMIRRLGLDGGEAPVIAVLRLPAGQTMASASGQAAAAQHLRRGRTGQPRRPQRLRHHARPPAHLGRRAHHLGGV